MQMRRVTTRGFRLSRPPVTGVLGQIAMRGLVANVVLLVVAMAFGGVEWLAGGAAGAFMTLVFLGNRLDDFRERGCHFPSPCLANRKRKSRAHRSRIGWEVMHLSF